METATVKCSRCGEETPAKEAWLDEERKAMCRECTRKRDAANARAYQDYKDGRRS
jgi:formylmethanofuran dehydrogenase subunit E